MKNFIHQIKKKADISQFIALFLLIVALILFTQPEAKSHTYQENQFFSPTATTHLDPPDKAPDATFKDASGKKVSISELSGKVIFINFWATWCGPCRVEMPTINKLYDSLKNNEDIVFLIVDADRDYEKANKYIAKTDLTLPIYEPVGNIPYVYFSGALPTTVMINKEGEIVFRHAGAADYFDPKMLHFVEELIRGEK